MQLFKSLLAKFQKNSPQDRIFFFLHIPKTGGYSVFQTLERCFDPSEIFQKHLLGDFCSLPSDQIANYRFIRGHYCADCLGRLPASQTIAFTVLRDPVGRALSHLKYLRGLPDMWVHQRRDLTNASFEEMLDQESIRQLLDNHQLRRLITPMPRPGDRTPLPLLGPAQLSDEDLEKGLVQLQRFSLVIDHAHLDSLLAGLKRYERFQELPERFPEINVTPKRPDKDLVSQAVHEQLSELVKLEQRLFERWFEIQ